MDNEATEQVQQEVQAEPQQENDVQTEEVPTVNQEELEALRSEVVLLKLKLALISAGAAPERLDEGMKLAAGLMNSDELTPEDAAGKVLAEYPHIRLAKRVLPQLSAESSGCGDGFAAIRNIFAKK